MDIYTITIAISILVYIAIGNYAGRGIKRLDDYYVAGRRAPTLLSLVGFSASNDIGIHRSQDEKKTLLFSRLIMLVIGTLALVAALIFPPDIFWLTTFLAPALLIANGLIMPYLLITYSYAHTSRRPKRCQQMGRWTGSRVRLCSR